MTHLLLIGSHNYCCHKKMSTKSKKPTPISQSSKAGITFPVGRIHRKLKSPWFKSSGRKLARYVDSGAAVFLAAALEYLTRDWLVIAGNIAKDTIEKC